MKKVFEKIIAITIFFALLITALPPFAIDTLAYNVGDIIELGTYPQTLVTDTSTTNLLNQKSMPWISYNYYTGKNKAGTMVSSDYMKYMDTTLSGEKYRGVVFSQYRPIKTWYQSTADNSRQDENGFLCNVVYWFKYEPIQWIVLDPDEGILITKNILDSQPFSDKFYMDSDDYCAYSDSSKSTQATNYPASSLRQWLKHDFFNTALSGPNNSCIVDSGFVYEINSTTYSDTVFTFTSKDLTNILYGYNADAKSADTARIAYGTDYAKIQGLYVSDDVTTEGYSQWRLLDHNINYTYCNCAVDCNGKIITTADTEDTGIGVRPCIKIDFTQYDDIPVTDYENSPTPSDTTTEFVIDSLKGTDKSIYENPLIKRVAQYCYPFNREDLQNDLDSQWNLSIVSDFNKYADRYNSLSASLKERCDLFWIAGGIEGINANEIYCAWNFKEYISKPGPRLVMGLSGLVYNGEAVGYLVGEWAEKDKYRAALENFIKVTKEDYQEFIYMKDAIDMLENILKTSGDIEATNKIESLTKNLYSCSSKLEFNNALYNFDFESNGKTTKATIKSYPLAEVFGYAGNTLEIVNITSSGIINLASISSEVGIYKQYQDFLNEISNDIYLPCALRLAAHELNQDIETQYQIALKEVSQEIQKFAAEEAISLSVNSLGSATASAALGSILLGIEIGKAIGNLVFGIDDIVQSCAYIECYAILSEKYADMVLTDKETFNSNKTIENALKFRTDYEILWDLRILGEKTYLEMSGCDSLYSPIIRAILRGISDYEAKKEFASANIEQLMHCRFTMDDNDKINMIEHREIYYETVVIGCPVDIMIYDINNNLVGKTTNNIIDTSITDPSDYPVCIYIDNDIKTIKLNSLSDYHIEISAFDSGTMTYTSTTVNAQGNPIKKTIFMILQFLLETDLR